MNLLYNYIPSKFKMTKNCWSLALLFFALFIFTVQAGTTESLSVIPSDCVSGNQNAFTLNQNNNTNNLETPQTHRFLSNCDAPANFTMTDYLWPPGWVSVNLSWNEGNANQWKYAYSIDSNFDPDQNFSTTNTADIDFGFLQLDTDYYFFVKAICDSGESQWIQTVYHTPIPECPTPSGLMVSEVTHNKVSMSWSDGGWGYEFVNAIHQIGITTTANTPVSGVDLIIDTPFTEIEVTGLNPNTVYYPWVRTICYAGSSPAMRSADNEDEGYYSEWITLGSGEGSSFTTLEAPFVCETPTNIEATQGEDYDGFATIQVSWISMGDETMWEVAYSEEPDSFSETAFYLETNENPYTIMYLFPDITYYVFVRAFCEDTEMSDWSEMATVNVEAATADCDEENYYISRVWAMGPGNIEAENTSGFDNDAVSDTYITTPVMTPGYADNTHIIYELNKSLGNMLTFAIEADGNHLDLTYTYEIWVDRNLDKELSNNGWGDYNERMFIYSIDGGDLNGAFDLNNPIINEFDQQLFFCDIPNGIFPMRIIMTVINSDCEVIFGETEDYLFEVTGDCSERLSIDNFIFDNFSYYPNPVETEINLNAIYAIEGVTVYNLMGMKVIEVNLNANQTQINIENLTAGLYMMKVTIGGTEKTFKVIKK